MRTLIAMVATLAFCAACSGADHRDPVYGARHRSAGRVAGGAGLEHVGVQPALARRLRAGRRRCRADRPGQTPCRSARRPLRSLRRAGASDGSRRDRQLRQREKHCHTITFRRRRHAADRHGVPGPAERIAAPSVGFTCTRPATASPAPPRPTRRRSRSGCCRPRRTTPAWWSKPPAWTRGGPTAPS